MLQNICALADAEKLLQDVIIVNNASTENYHAVKKFSRPDISISYFETEENLGVTRGRNFALQFAKGNICVFLDDDAVLQSKDALQNILRSFAEKGINKREVAVVSFKVLYYNNLQMQVNAFPHKNFSGYKRKNNFFTYYFAGGAHAIRRDVLNETGNLPEEFFYGMEEYDLSYRIIDKGYCIKYDGSIVMLHKESPLGRKTKKEKLLMMWVNKAKVAWKYLPQKYFYSTAIMWSMEYLLKTRFHLKGFFEGWKRILAIPHRIVRTPVKPSALAYFKSVKARLWY